MAVTQQQTVFTHTASGSATDFAYGCRILDDDDLVVSVDDVVKTNGVDYTVSGVLVQAGGTVTFGVAPVAASIVKLFRATVLERLTDYQTAGDFLADTVNPDFDRAIMALQDMQGGSVAIANSLRVPAGEAIGVLPIASARASKLLAFDSLGEPVALVGVDAGSAAALDLSLRDSVLTTAGAGQLGFGYGLGYGVGTIGKWLNDLAASAGTSFVGWIQTGTGAVARTMQSKMRELISSDDFNSTRGTENWGFGSSVLDSVTPAGAGTGVQNVGIGTDVLTALTEGFGNTGVGHRALRLLTTPAYCSAFGIRALENAERTADVNLACTAFGAYALNANTNGQYNIGVGYNAGLLNQTGFFNTWVGTQSGKANVVGTNNTGLGHATLILATGSRNVGLGAFALQAQTSGNDTIGIGHQALFANQNGVASVGIGSNALASATVGPNIGIGHLAGQSIQTGVDNVAIGPAGVMGTASGAASRNVAIGANALNLLTTNSDSTAVGDKALDVTTGGTNTAIGASAGGADTTGVNNVFVGYLAGTDAVATVTTASNQIVVGNNSSTNAFIKIAWTVTSDARDKTDLSAVDRGLDFVMKLRPMSFKLMDRETQQATTGKRFGFLAQDIQALEVDGLVLVDAHDAENLKLRESMMVPILVKALQDLKREFDDYRAQHERKS